MREEQEKISSDDDFRDGRHDDPTENIAFSSQKEAADYERKKANAMLANPLRGLSHDELRKMGRQYALGV